MADHVRFRVCQNGVTVARVEGSAEAARLEIHRYAEQYREDGEVTIQYNAAGHWKRYALLCQWPILEAANG